MTEKSFLPHLIHEEIYVLSDTTPAKESGKADTKTVGVIVGEEDLNTHEQLLWKILEATSWKKEDCTILKTTDDLSDTSDYSFILEFGVDDSQFGGDQYSPIANNDTTVLRSNSLAELSTDVELKKKLWGCLKDLLH